METQSLQKMQTMARVIAVFAKIARITFWVSTGLCAAGLIFVGDGPLLKVGKLTVYPLVSTAAAGVKEAFPGTLVLTLVFSICMAILMLYVERFCGSLSDSDTPFTHAAAQSLRRMGVWMMLSSLLPTIAQNIVAVLWPASSADFFTSFSPSDVLFIVFFCLLARVFDYGASLQQQADETL